MNTDTDTENVDKYLELSETDIDFLLYDITLESEKNTDELKRNSCSSCNNENLVFDDSNGYYLCDNCGTINNEILNKIPDYNKEDSSSSYGCPSNPFFILQSITIILPSNIAVILSILV